MTDNQTANHSTRPVIAFAGGGTAGHVNPLLSTVAALRETGLDFDCFVLGTAKGLEKDLVPGAGLELVTIARLPMPRRPSLDLVKLPFRLRSTVRGLSHTFVSRGVSLLVGFGGYVSTPAYLAARAQGIPVVIHEQNARPGLANRLGARWAQAVGLTFPGTPLAARRGRTEVTGLPLRPAIAQLAQHLATPQGRDQARTAAAQFFDLDASRPTVLLTGGSLGAQFLNETLPGVLVELEEKPQVIHLTGRGKDAPVRDFVTAVGVEGRYRVLDYLDQMHHALALADVVLCRSGAVTVAENSALGIPAIYVPLPHGNGEQALNANSVVQAGGARCVSQDQVDASQMTQLLHQMLDPDRNAQMRQVTLAVGTTQGGAKLSALIRSVLDRAQI